MIEKINLFKNFEQNSYTEIEKKYRPLNPGKLDRFRAQATAIEQIYLSHPDDEYSLRIRWTDGNQPTYVPTLKDRGRITQKGLERIEINGVVSQKRYEYYRSGNVPVINKFRYQPEPGVAIDYFTEDNYVQAESENPAAWERFLDQYDLHDEFVEITGEPESDNRTRAHNLFRQTNGCDAFEQPDELTADEVVEQILRRRGQQTLVATVAGRSGAGKTTLLNTVRASLREHGISSSTLSTDDYNHGRTYRERLASGQWTNYDSNETYDLALCMMDVKRLKIGHAVAKRAYDFDSDEPIVDGFVEPSDVILLEGIKAPHPLFAEVADLSFVIPTSLATSIGRRIIRDLRERPRFAEPGTNLSVYLEYAEPEYRAMFQN